MLFDAVVAALAPLFANAGRTLLRPLIALVLALVAGAGATSALWWTCCAVWGAAHDLVCKYWALVATLGKWLLYFCVAALFGMLFFLGPISSNEALLDTATDVVLGAGAGVRDAALWVTTPVVAAPVRAWSWVQRTYAPFAPLQRVAAEISTAVAVRPPPDEEL